jgi:hypothetical protein
MRTLSSIANSKTGFSGRPISVRQLLDKMQVDSATKSIAAYSINDFHRRTGGSFGPLGRPVGSVTRLGDGSYQRSFQLGSANMKTLDSPVAGQTEYNASVILAAISCLDTFSKFPSHTDSTYAVISVISINPNETGQDVQVATFRTDIQDDVKPGNIIFEGTTIGNTVPTGTGIAIHVALWRHVDGDADKIRDQIHSALNDAVDKVAAAMAANSAAADDTSTSGGTAGDISNFRVGGIKPIDLLTLGIANWVAQFFADKLIGQHTFEVPAGNIIDLSDQAKFDQSLYQKNDPVYTSGQLTPDIQINWPPPQDPNPSFSDSDGGANYKVYFLIKGHLIPPSPVNPSLSG